MPERSRNLQDIALVEITPEDFTKNEKFRGKTEEVMKKFGKMSSIFEFSISKLGCIEFFMKICGEKIFHTKIRLHDNFHENLRKKILTHFLKIFLTNSRLK